MATADDPSGMKQLAVSILLLAVAACGTDGSTDAARSYTVQLRADDSGAEYRYVTDQSLAITTGDEVTFELHNDGALPHDVQVVAPDGTQVGLAPVADAGATTSVTVRFDEPGYYRLNCLVDDHLTAHGMQAIIEVT